MLRRSRMSRWAAVSSAVWRKVSAGSVKVPRVSRLSSSVILFQVVSGGGLGDADEQEGEPAQDDVGADPLLEPVAGRPPVDDLLEVAPAALDLEEQLVADGDVSGGEPGVGAAEQVLAVEVLLRFDLCGVCSQQAAGGDGQAAVQAGLV
jgi:hypothetical protein